MTWSRGWSTDEKPKKWIPVEVPRSVFDSPDEKRRYEAAMARCPRQPGEDVVAWIERVGAEARGPAPLLRGRLPYSDPADEPGAEKE